MGIKRKVLTLGLRIFVLFIDFHVCLHFLKICLRFEKTVKRYQYGYQKKGLEVGVENMWFVYRFSCLFTFFGTLGPLGPLGPLEPLGPIEPLGPLEPIGPYGPHGPHGPKVPRSQ